jgi:hypothetical protein
MTRQHRLDGTPPWGGHKAVREREAFIAPALPHLGALPPAGIHVGSLPLKLARAGAAPARVAAFVGADAAPGWSWFHSGGSCCSCATGLMEGSAGSRRRRTACSRSCRASSVGTRTTAGLLQLA